MLANSDEINQHIVVCYRRYNLPIRLISHDAAF